MPSRRDLLFSLVAAPLALPRTGNAQDVSRQLALTPQCDDGDDLTPPQTEGPYFTPRSPEKQDFASDAPDGERMTIAGFVLTRDCRPVAGALVELWHADETGAYDNRGYRLRGHQFTGPEGRWWFDTIVPGLYPGRTRHFHLKVQREGGSVLTTQLYFPGEPRNDRDRIFHPALLLEIAMTGDGRFGRYDFVVA